MTLLQCGITGSLPKPRWLSDPNAQLRASFETVAPSQYSRRLGCGLPSVRPRQQVSLDLRKRWNY